jgi:hypothetical protein
MNDNPFRAPANEVIRALDPFNTHARHQLPGALGNLALALNLPTSQLQGESHGTVALLLFAHFLKDYGGTIAQLHAAHTQLHGHG